MKWLDYTPHLGSRGSSQTVWKYPQKVHTEDIIKIANFVCKNTFLSLTQISKTAIGIRVSPSYTFIFMDYIETEYLETQSQDFTWTDSEENFQKRWMVLIPIFSLRMSNQVRKLLS